MDYLIVLCLGAALVLVALVALRALVEVFRNNFV